MKRLFLFTHEYPFGGGETFLEGELTYLAGSFERICLIPAWISGNPRPVPDNVSVVIKPGRKPGKTIPRLISGLASVDYRILRREITSNRFFFSRPIKTFWRAVTYLDEALKIYRWLVSVRGELEINFDQDVFYSYWMRGQALGLSLLAETFPAVKFISRAHGGDLYLDRYIPPYLPYREKIFQAANWIFSVSKHGQQYIRDQYPLASPKTIYAPLGIMDPGFTTRASGDGVIQIVSCSSLIPVKRPGLIIAGLRNFGLRNPGKSVMWHHLGGGPLSGDLLRMGKILLPENIEMVLHGQLTHDEVFSFYKKHPVDVFINVSLSEGAPVAIMEAQSCGIPVIAPAVGGIAELVNTENGYLLPATPEPSNIADAISEILSDHLQKSQKSKQHWRLEYNAENNYPRFIKLLEEKLLT